VHANQRPGHNSLGGWEIPHHDLAVVVQTDQRPGNKRDLLDMLMGVRTRCNPW
jgi:hypothetical protein